MRNKILLIAIAVLILALGFSRLGGRWIIPQRDRAARGVGSHAEAPDFSLTALNGQPLALAGYKGKVVLLNFWATWCGPCEKEIPEFIALQDRYGQQGLQVIGLSMDDGPKPVTDFYQRFKMNYPVAMADSQVAQQYGGIYGLPVNFLIGRDGRIAAKYAGATDLEKLEEQIKAQLSLAADGAR